MQKFLHEYRHFLTYPHAMRILLLTNLIYAFVLPVIDIFVGAYVMRNSQDVRMVVLRTRDGLIDAPRWGLLYMRLTGQLSITNYLRLENSGEVYTIETPMHLPMKDRVRIHRRAFERIFLGVLP